MKKSVFVFLIAILCCCSAYSSEIKLFFEKKNRASDIHPENTIPLYKLYFDTLKIKSKENPENVKILPLIKPDIKNSKDTAFFRIFFTGFESSEKTAYERVHYCIVGNYKADTTYIWVDLNNNLNFTDDNALYTLTKDTSIIIKFYNSKVENGIFQYKISKIKFRDSVSKASIVEHYYVGEGSEGAKTTEPDYWLSEVRLNILSCDTVIKGEKVQIGLFDNNCNGLYIDMDTVTPNYALSDRVLIGEYGNSIISSDPCDGAVALIPETLFKINNQVYWVKEVEQTGKYIIMEETDKPYNILSAGDKVPDLELTLFNNEKANLKELIIPGIYNLIDIWGFWCKGCVLTLPQLKEYDSLYSDRINIIGLHCYKSSKKKAREFVEQYEMKWTQGFLNSNIEKTLLSNSYPFYILIDPNGKIVKFNIRLNEVEEIIKGKE
ncbi:MAG TPA: TlpA disulfide reductase family protein [Candidatus Kapabacteria bacterium]|nr:TlpA disulfide reductase family protein [Candidatus Kapabacteria bacterium]